MKRLIIIEDQTTLRGLVYQWIESNTDIEIVAEAGDGQEGLDLCLEHKPDLLITDIILPTLNGSEVMKRLRAKKALPTTLIFSAISEKNAVSQLLKLGATGIVSKSAPLEVLTEGILSIAEGKTYFSPDVVDLMREIMQSGDLDKPPKLTSRENQIVQLIANSYTNRQIASLLDTSVRTVDTHRNNIMKKLGLHDAAALTRWAITNHLIDPFANTLPQDSDTSKD